MDQPVRRNPLCLSRRTVSRGALLFHRSALKGSARPALYLYGSPNPGPLRRGGPSFTHALTVPPAQVVAARNPLMGFGKVTVRLAGALAAMFVLVSMFPSLLFATALVPANTLMAHFFIWNVLTAPFVETSFLGAAVAIGVTLLVGKQLEPLWGSKEMLRFILVVTVSTSCATFFTCIFLYASSQNLAFIYDPVHGYCGLTGAYLVAVKQLLPEQQTKLCGVVKAKTKDLAGIYFVAYLMFFVLFNGHFGEFLFVAYGTFSGWFYLRFWQPRDGGVVGDQHNDAFGFISFFPPQMHPAVTILVSSATICHTRLFRFFWDISWEMIANHRRRAASA